MHLQHWVKKFRCAFHGLWIGAIGQSSFLVHYVAAILTLGLAVWLKCSLTQWCLLLLCIGAVLGAEYLNSALERLARGLCREQNADVGAALDIASAAVLIVSICSAIIGGLIFVSQFLMLR